MIAQSHRFHGYHSLRHVYARGVQVRGQYLSVKYLPRGGHRPYRAAVVVSRKVRKSAVVRNRIRRRLYEIIRTSPYLTLPGFDMVFTVYQDRVATMETAELAGVMQALAAKRAPRAHDIVEPVNSNKANQ